MSRSIDLLITGIGQLFTARGNGPKSGAALADARPLAGQAVACHAGRILEVGPAGELAGRYRASRRLDAAGSVVLPGLVDAHTHPVFHGTREEEFERRSRGESYAEIAKSGGGIAASLAGVRAHSRETLLEDLLGRLDRFLVHGTTTVEAKTGYGLTVEDELKCLEVIAEAQRLHPVDLVPTFLGAHAVPPEYADRRDAYTDLVVEEMLPRVAETGLARFCDVFAEAGAFDLRASRRILGRARELGLGLRLHVDQLTPLGGAELAAELGAASADHLEHVSPAGIEALAAAGVVPVLCPLVPLYLREPQEAPARRMVEAGLAPALATDFNPGSCYLQSLFEVASFAALRHGFSSAEALTGTTLNAAASLGLAAEIGTIEAGKRADLVLTDLPDARHLVYELGRNPVACVVKDGIVVFEREPLRLRRETAER